jgi:glycosyltransferase involved in cell wall biosynthesis
MRITYLTHQYFPRHIGGTEVYTQSLAEQALTRGDEVRIYTYVESPSGDPNDYGIREVSHNKIPVFEIHYNLSTAPHPALYEYDNPFVGQLLREELEQFQPDIVHATHLMKISGAVIPTACLLDIPIIITLTDFWTICTRHTLLRWNGALCKGPRHPLDCTRCIQDTHGIPSYQPPWFTSKISNHRPRKETIWTLLQDLGAISKRNPFLRKQLEGVSKIIVLSEFQKRMLVRNGLPSSSMIVIPHGLEPYQEPEKMKTSEGKPRILFIGTIAPHKGLHILIQALEQIPEIELHLEIYGKVREGDPYASGLIQETRSDSRVHWMGTFPPDDLVSIVAGADAIALPAQWYENAPFFVQAGIITGTPVLASNLGSLTEMLENQPGHVLLDHDDIKSWADALQEVAEGELLKPMPIDLPTTSQHIDQVFSMYDECLKGIPHG